VFGLALDDVDFLRRVVHVRHQVRMVSARLVLAPPKGGKERDVPLPDSVALRLGAARRGPAGRRDAAVEGTGREAGDGAADLHLT